MSFKERKEKRKKERTIKKANKKWEELTEELDNSFKDSKNIKARHFVYLYKLILNVFSLYGCCFTEEQLLVLYNYNANVAKKVCYYLSNDNYSIKDMEELTKLLIYPKEQFVLFGVNLSDIEKSSNDNLNRLSKTLDFFNEKFWGKIISNDLYGSGNTYNRIEMWFCRYCKINVKNEYPKNDRFRKDDDIYSLILISSLALALIVYNNEGKSLDQVHNSIKNKLEEKDLNSLGLFLYASFCISEMKSIKGSNITILDNPAFSSISEMLKDYEWDKLNSLQFFPNDIKVIKRIIDIKLDKKMYNDIRSCKNEFATCLNYSFENQDNEEWKDKVRTIFEGVSQ